MATYPPSTGRSGADPGAERAAAIQARTALSAGRPVPLGLIAFGIPAFTFGSVMAGWGGASPTSARSARSEPSRR